MCVFTRFGVFLGILGTKNATRGDGVERMEVIPGRRRGGVYVPKFAGSPLTYRLSQHVNYLAVAEDEELAVFYQFTGYG